jgi:hypothetical protein
MPCKMSRNLFANISSTMFDQMLFHRQTASTKVGQKDLWIHEKKYLGQSVILHLSIYYSFHVVELFTTCLQIRDIYDCLEMFVFFDDFLSGHSNERSYRHQDTNFIEHWWWLLFLMKQRLHCKMKLNFEAAVYGFFKIISD